MARRRRNDDNSAAYTVLTFGAIGVCASAAYEGRLGPEAQAIAFWWKDLITGFSLPKSPAPAPGPCNYSARLCEMIRAFSGGDFKAVMDSWQDWASTQSGMMTCNWAAFRNYMVSQWHFDPGANEPPEFSARCWGGGDY